MTKIVAGVLDAETGELGTFALRWRSAAGRLSSSTQPPSSLPRDTARWAWLVRVTTITQLWMLGVPLRRRR